MYVHVYTYITYTSTPNPHTPPTPPPPPHTHTHRGYVYSSPTKLVVNDCAQDYILQWNLSNLDTLGAQESVLISEVS